jgi:hypothetical protein
MNTIVILMPTHVTEQLYSSTAVLNLEEWNERDL